MNYPVWAIEDLGGSTLIAIISIFHVFVAHLAVGGGLYIWLLELRYQRTGSELLRGYLYRYTWFFLLVTMVFGGLTGVGIWFIISLVSPQATSLLIHTFVFGWAIEWVFFVGEIVSLLVYYYKYDSLGPKPRVVTAFLYFLFAWLSLAVINGILSFMLTPGRWIETKEFWDGFLNPTYLPSTLFRSFY
ncbi:MAG: cytochrome ubiquinol oxidase subunit I, partial [Desulfatiglandales bacterium]